MIKNAKTKNLPELSNDAWYTTQDELNYFDTSSAVGGGAELFPVRCGEGILHGFFIYRASD